MPKTDRLATLTEPELELLVKKGTRRNAPVGEELRGQRRDGQVEALDAQRGNAEDDANHRRRQSAEQERDEERHAVDANHEVVGRVGADGHEGAGAERDLAAVADQDVEPEGGEREDQERDQDRPERVLVGDERHGDEGDDEQQADRDPVLQDREDLLVGAVARLELAVLAVQHGQTRSMIFSPNSPCGRTRRKPRAST